MSEAPPFRPGEILRVLQDAEVDFVVIGGLASQAHGSPSLTGDIDICYERSPANLARLSQALKELAAIRRGDDAFARFPLDVRALRSGDVFTTSTRFGVLDLLGNPDPGLSYAELRTRALSVPLHGRTVWVASLEDVIAMKRAAGRPKDRVELEILGALREELDRRD